MFQAATLTQTSEILGCRPIRPMILGMHSYQQPKPQPSCGAHPAMFGTSRGAASYLLDVPEGGGFIRRTPLSAEPKGSPAHG